MMNTNPSVFSIEGKTFVSGLVWQTQPEDSTKDDLLQLAAELDSDLFVRRNEPPVQYGFVSSAIDKQIKNGVCSIAAIISKTMDMEGFPGNVLAALRLPDDRFIIYAQRSHAILPLNGDVIGAEDEMYEVFNDHLAMEWDSIIAPDTWGIAKSANRSIDSFFPLNSKGKIKHHNWWQLRYIDEQSKSIKKLLGVIFVMALGFAAVYSYKRYEQINIDKETQARLAQEAEIKAKEGKRNAVVALPHPWATIARPDIFVETCLRELYKMPFSPAGWKMDSLSCSADSSNATYTRNRTTVLDFVRSYPDAAITPDGEHATITLQHTLQCCDPEEVVLPKREVSLRMISFAQTFSTQMPLEQPPVAPVSPDPEIPSPIPDWTEFKWSYQVIGNPIDTIKRMDMPGIRVEKISYIPQPGVWFIEGKVYASTK